MSIFTNWPQPAEIMLNKPSSIKKDCYMYTCQWLGNIDMHMYAKCDETILCSSKAHLFVLIRIRIKDEVGTIKHV